MASNKIFGFGPIALTNSATNLFNPDVTSGGVNDNSTALYALIRHIAVVNKSAAAATFSLWKGLTGANTAGTEVIASARSIAVGDTYHWYGVMRFDTADFLVGIASVNTALTIQAEGEIGVAG